MGKLPDIWYANEKKSASATCREFQFSGGCFKLQKMYITGIYPF